uniref:Retrotransposon gag domain-containing protein n=1 Tax=Nicotiana tabacum TaxID=4097 RepID=A0A1S4DLV4_TOBAC|nr:PREDICTED: uncharacterized protein LOC107830967 [Nicotiana tabacum]
MEEMKNENKAPQDQMKEHQERVNKIPGAPKLLLKRDAGRFVEQPYSDSAALHVKPKTFKMTPYLKIYEGNDLVKEQVSSILLKKFSETLTGGELTWYSQLPAHSIETFEEMADKFVMAHAGAKKAEERVNDIFDIKQYPREGLRDFLAFFNQVRMTLPNVSEGIEVAAFQNGLNRNDEDDLNGPTHLLTSVQAESRKDRRSDIKIDPATSWPNRESHLPYVRTTVVSSPRHEEGPPRSRTWTHPNEREIVYALEKLGLKVKWPQRMRSDTNTKKSDALCEFHQEQGHKTKDCITLRQEVVNMLRQGHLKELLSDRGRTNFARGREQHQGPLKPSSPARTIHLIIGGGDDASINSIPT